MLIIALLFFLLVAASPLSAMEEPTSPEVDALEKTFQKELNEMEKNLDEIRYQISQIMIEDASNPTTETVIPFVELIDEDEEEIKPPSYKRMRYK
jgi:hypothetical protein